MMIAMSLVSGNHKVAFDLLALEAWLFSFSRIIGKIKASSNIKKAINNPADINNYMKMSGKEIAIAFMTREIKKIRGDEAKLVSGKLAKCRILITAIFCVFLYVLLHFRNINPYSFDCAAVVIAAYIVALLFFDNGYFLCKAAKMNNEPFDRVIESEAVDESDTGKHKLSFVLCAVMIAAVLGVFVGFNAKTEIKTAPVEGGCTVSQYKQGFFDREDTVVIPEKIEGKTVVSISKKAFAGNRQLRSITLPDTVLYIEKAAFSGCTSLSDIKPGENVVRIDSAAFKGCTSLKSIELPDSLKELNGEAFMNCSSLESVVIPEGVTEIRGSSFEGCKSLESVTLHDGIIDIHANAFMNCKALKDIELPSKITEIHAYTFEGCESLIGIDIPSGVTRIAAHAFYGCKSLSTVNVPDTLKEIGSSAFRECDSLIHIYLPEGVSINEKAFKDSPTKRLKKVFDDETKKKIDEEIENIKVTEIYVVCNKENGDYIIDEDYEALVTADSELFNERLTDDMTLKRFATPSEFLEYLKAVKEDGIEKVQINYYSKIASQVRGETTYMFILYNTDDLIETYENDPTEF